MVTEKIKHPKACSKSHWYNILSGHRYITYEMAKKLEPEMGMPWRRLIGMRGKAVRDIYESAK